MTKEYRKEWGPTEAVREIVQNCIDNKQCKHQFIIIDDVIVVRTLNFTLPMNTFALGESQNKTNNSIGGFGEGFKLALLVLEREKLQPKVLFGNKVAIPYFVYDELLENDIFNIVITERDDIITNTSFQFNFPAELVDELKLKVTVFADKPLTQDMDNVELLEDRPGEIFVNGLFVCEEAKFKYGYNFPAHSISLGCDREIANPLGLAWETSRYWSKRTTDNSDIILQMMTDAQLDVQDIHWHLEEHQAVKITKAFSERYGNVTIKPMGSSLSYGMPVGGSLYNTLAKSKKIKVANPHEENGTPYRTLLEFLQANKKHMRRCAKKNLQNLIDNSKGWS